MHKKNSVKKLGRPAGERVAMIRSQVKDLIERGHIKTTKAKAKQVIAQLDKLITAVKANRLKAVNEYLKDENLETKLGKINFGERKTGFASMITLKNRAGDNAELVLVELIKA